MAEGLFCRGLTSLKTKKAAFAAASASNARPGGQSGHQTPQTQQQVQTRPMVCPGVGETSLIC